MTQPIVLKRSATASKVPTTGQLQDGELAINTYDGVLYTRKNPGTPVIVEVGAAALTGDVTGNISKGAGALTLANSGVTAGTYTSVTVDAKGRVTAGTAGGVLQLVAGTIGQFSGTTQLPSTTTPTTSSGTQIWSQAITMTTGTKVLLRSQCWGDYSANGRYITVAFFRNTTLIGLTVFDVANSGIMNSCSYMDYDTGLTPGTAYTYSCRVGGSGNGTWYINQDKNGNRYGGGFNNSFTLEELP